MRYVGYRSFNFTQEYQNKIEDWKKENTFYGVVNIRGKDCLISETKFSTFIEKTKLLNKTLLMRLKDNQQTICKIIFIDEVGGTFDISVLDKLIKKQRVSLNRIDKIFEIHSIL